MNIINFNILDLDKTIQDLSKDGVKVTVYANPHFIEGSKMFEEAKLLDHLLKDKNSKVYLQNFGGFFAGTVDLASEISRNWFAGIIICIFNTLNDTNVFYR